MQCVLCKYFKCNVAMINLRGKFVSPSIQLKKECDNLNDQLKEMKMR